MDGADFASKDDFACDLGPRHIDAFDRALAEVHRLGDEPGTPWNVPVFGFESGLPYPAATNIYRSVGIGYQEGKRPSFGRAAYDKLMAS